MSVVALTIPQPGDPDKDLIAALEKLLTEVKSGAIQGIAYAVMYSDGTYQVDWDGRATALPMYGAVGMLSHVLGEALDSVPSEERYDE